MCSTHDIFPAHPRLRLNADGIDKIRRAAASDLVARQLLLNVTAYAESLLTQPLPTDASELLCDTIRDHMYSMGLAYRLSQNETLRASLAFRATSELLLVSGAASWDPARFLTVAETMHGVAIGYDWFFDELSSHSRIVIEDALMELAH